jgi:hypothetical protein
MPLSLSLCLYLSLHRRHGHYNKRNAHVSLNKQAANSKRAFSYLCNAVHKEQHRQVEALISHSPSHMSTARSSCPLLVGLIMVACATVVLGNAFASTQPMIAATDPRIRWIGRVNVIETPLPVVAFDWASSGFQIIVTNTTSYVDRWAEQPPTQPTNQPTSKAKAMAHLLKHKGSNTKAHVGSIDACCVEYRWCSPIAATTTTCSSTEFAHLLSIQPTGRKNDMPLHNLSTQLRRT